jgi:hypothetical protein
MDASPTHNSVYIVLRWFLVVPPKDGFTQMVIRVIFKGRFHYDALKKKDMVTTYQFDILSLLQFMVFFIGVFSKINSK